MAFVDSSEISLSIRNAVHHLKQLGDSFRTNTFNDDDLNNIDYVADTLMALEKEILKLHGDYETQSIGSSQLRHRLKLLPNTIKNEIQAAVRMARESNISVIQKLQKELDGHLQLVREYTERDAQFNVAISTLQGEKNSLQQRYDTTISEVNNRLSDKATLQINLNETRDTVRETNEYTLDLEEDIMALKERLMQERNEARQEKVRLEEEFAVTSKRHDEQDKTNQLLKKDVDLALHKVSESEMQLRTMYRERERFENEANELRKKIAEQTEFYEKEQQEHDRILRERLQFAETCGIALLDFQTKKASLEKRSANAHERTTEETDKLKTLKQKHDEVTKQMGDFSEASKALENSVSEAGKELEEIKLDIGTKLEKTAKLNLDNADTTKELEAMREAHQIMLDSLKIQMETFQKELDHIRNTRVSKQKQREILLKTIEETRLTSRNNDIRHNRFVSQTTARVTDLSERKTILDRNVREDQLQIHQLGDQLTNLNDEYRQMKTQFEEQIKYLKETTTQLLAAIDINRKKIIETTPEFECLKDEHEKVTAIYESTKETMIETKRKKQDMLDQIAGVERAIRDKNKSRDIAILAVRESQRKTQEQMQNAHDNMLKLEGEIYEKGCRLETLQHENENFQQAIDHMKHQIDLFNRFTEQSSIDIKNLDQDNHGLVEILESGWNNDRQLEDRSARKDLEFIDDLTTLLKHTEKRKAKVGTIVRRLIGELQQLKYYLEGMSNPPTPALPLPTPDRPSRTRSSHRRRSISEERVQSPSEPNKTPRRPQSTTRGETTTPIQLTDDVQQQVSEFVEDNFDIKTTSSKKTSKTGRVNRSLARRSARTDYSSRQSAASPSEDTESRENPRVAFA